MDKKELKLPITMMKIISSNKSVNIVQFNDYDYFKILRNKIISRTMDCEEKIDERKYAIV